MKHIFCILIMLAAWSCFAQKQTGIASYYADKFEGTYTANGEKYKHRNMTAAHKFLPFGTRVRVTNLKNQKSVEVVINDRGPYVEGRIIDLSKSAAEALDFILEGLTEVHVEVIDAGDGKQTTQPNTFKHAIDDAKEYYSMNIHRLPAKGFGVQIGTYKVLANLFRLAENLRHSYRKKVVIQVKLVDNIPYYGLIIGHFSSRTKAHHLLTSLKKKYPGAFVVGYSGLAEK